MSSRTRHSYHWLCLGSFILLAGMLGCSRAPTGQPEKPPTQKPPVNLGGMRQPPTTELLPKGSGLYSRTTIKGGVTGATVVEEQLVYEDGGKGTLKYREPEGTLAETEEYYASGKVRSQAKFAADGKRLASGKIFRPDGTLFLSAEREADGLLRVDRYWANGKDMFVSTRTDDENGAGTRNFYREDNSLAAIATLVGTQKPKPGERPMMIHETLYVGKDGKHLRKAAYLQQSTEVTWFAPDGKTATHKQTWSRQGGNGHVQGSITAVEEYEADGVTVKRRMHLVERVTMHLSPLKAEMFEGGKLVRVRYFRSAVSGALQNIETIPVPDIEGYSIPRYYRDGTVEKDEFIGPDGKVKDSKNYEFADAQTEVVDSKLLLQHKDPELEKSSRLFVLGPGKMEALTTAAGDICREWSKALLADYRR